MQCVRLSAPPPGRRYAATTVPAATAVSSGFAKLQALLPDGRVLRGCARLPLQRSPVPGSICRLPPPPPPLALLLQAPFQLKMSNWEGLSYSIGERDSFTSDRS